jgi:hypothetical protein
VTSLDGTHFSAVCETSVVNAHGCAMQTPVKLDPGVPLHFHSRDGRETTGQVVSCEPIGADHRSWSLGAKLDRPENFWGVKACPKDWIVWTLPPAAAPKPTQIFKYANSQAPTQMPRALDASPEPAPDRAAQAEALVRKMIAESVRPLQADVTAIKEKLAQREANPSRFEVSLSSIPPDLEQQLELRLRQNLGPRIVDEARQQSAHMLASAKATVEQQTTEACELFTRRAAADLTAIEKRAQEISQHISENAREYFHRGLQEFHQQLLQGGNSLKHLSEELLEFLRQSLDAEFEARRADIETVRAALAAESLRLRDEVEYLDTRIAKLDESVRCLESGLDQRLSRMSSDTVRETRQQFETAAHEIFEELTTRSVNVLGEQLQEATDNMAAIQNGIVASVSESLKVQAANASQTFERSLEELTKLSVERCRLRLEEGLKAVSHSLSEQFR